MGVEMDEATMNIWHMLFHPHRISEAAEPLANEETEEFRKAKREFDQVYTDFQKAREGWKEHHDE